MQQSKLDAGIAEFREALRLDPTLARAHFGLGNAYKLQGRAEQAIEALEEFLRLNDDVELRAAAESLLTELKGP